MKQTLWVFKMFILLFIISSCNKDDAKEHNAILTGWDATECACCGGLMVTFGEETKPYTGEYKLIQNSEELNITPEADFPIYAIIEYTENGNIFCSNFIKVTKFKRVY